MRPIAIILFLFTVIVAASCKPKKSTNTSPTPAPTPVVMQRPDLNAVCNRIVDGNPQAVSSPQGEWKYMVKMIDALYSPGNGGFTAAGRPRNPEMLVATVYRKMEEFGLCAAYDGDHFFIRGPTGSAETYSFYHKGNYWPLVEPGVSFGQAPRTPPPWDKVTMSLTACTPCGLPVGVFNENDPTNYCRLSKEGEVQKYSDDVNAAINAMLAEERANPTGLIDFNDKVDNGVDSFKIHGGDDWLGTYLERIAGHLRKKGYCALRTFGTQDGLSLKRGTNESEDYYDLVQGHPTGDYIRRYFHSRCYPAGF